MVANTFSKLQTINQFNPLPLTKLTIKKKGHLDLPLQAPTQNTLLPKILCLKGKGGVTLVMAKWDEECQKWICFLTLKIPAEIFSLHFYCVLILCLAIEVVFYNHIVYCSIYHTISSCKLNIHTKKKRKGPIYTRFL